MDVRVIPTSESTWSPADLLGRPVASVECRAVGVFRIVPDPRSQPIFKDSRLSGHISLDHALSEIARAIHGQCRLETAALTNAGTSTSEPSQALPATAEIPAPERLIGLGRLRTVQPAGADLIRDD